MATNLDASLIRVCNRNGDTVGTGFLVSRELAVTCAHVVERCQCFPGDRIHVTFYTNGETSEAEVVRELWRTSETDDIAFLRLLPKDPRLIEGVQPVKLGAARHSAGHEARVVGFSRPADYEFDRLNVRIFGTVDHAGRQPMLRLDAREHLPEQVDEEANLVVSGMSGAPVFDSMSELVVGMFNEFLPGTSREWATTSETIVATCVELKLHLPLLIEEYLLAVRNYCENLPYLTLFDSRPARRLNQVYVPLGLQALSLLQAVEEISPVERYARLPTGATVDLKDVMKTPGHAIIWGDAGAGKSVLLRLLAKSAWEAPEEVGLDQPYLPLIVPLSRIARGSGTFYERLRVAASAELALARPLPDDFFDEWSAETDARWIVLLDGLDDVLGESRDESFNLVLSWVRQATTHRLVLASRRSRVPVDESLFHHWEILPLNEAQITIFATKWFDSTNDAKDFAEAFRRSRTGSLSSSPLMLTVAALLFSPRASLALNRAVLYKEFIDRLLRKEEQHALREQLGEIAWAHRFLLQRLARWSYEELDGKSKLFDALTHQVARILESELKLAKPRAIELAKRYRQLIESEPGILVRRGDEIDFVHPSFREHLVGETIASEWEELSTDAEGKEQQFHKYITDPHWNEPLVQAVGLLPLGLTRELLDYVAERDPVLTAQCLRAAEEVRVDADIERIKQRLISDLFTMFRIAGHNWVSLCIYGLTIVVLIAIILDIMGLAPPFQVFIYIRLLSESFATSAVFNRLPILIVIAVVVVLLAMRSLSGILTGAYERYVLVHWLMPIIDSFACLSPIEARSYLGRLQSFTESSLFVITGLDYHIGIAQCKLADRTDLVRDLDQHQRQGEGYLRCILATPMNDCTEEEVHSITKVLEDTRFSVFVAAVDCLVQLRLNSRDGDEVTQSLLRIKRDAKGESFARRIIAYKALHRLGIRTATPIPMLEDLKRVIRYVGTLEAVRALLRRSQIMTMIGLIALSVAILAGLLFLLLKSFLLLTEGR